MGEDWKSTHTKYEYIDYICDEDVICIIIVCVIFVIFGYNRVIIICIIIVCNVYIFIIFIMVMVNVVIIRRFIVVFIFLSVANMCLISMFSSSVFLFVF